MRIGIGYDVHPLVRGRQLIIGGVSIPHKKGLLGHSDADVLCHAITDALLGAAGLGDIGRHFPDTDPAYRGADSISLMKSAYKMVMDTGLVFNNLDAVIIAQAPLLKDYMPEMEKNIARALESSMDMINVKATTTEGLGYIGKKKGISASAVVTLKEK